eukprot:TRINITY_DN4480_c0_g1_i2.p1 TRINITY_DN4480_c0_g1~~TRINITY_DN4480_c0_g1_i2.p1  ORF type:complete len:454 (+),score=68.01 TRINITY_DN4480_c0_g1_i2:195-1556(+)
MHSSLRLLQGPARRVTNRRRGFHTSRPVGSLLDINAFTIVSQAQRQWPQVFYGRYVVQQGEVVGVWSRSGRYTRVQGPKSIFGWGSSVVKLQYATADPSQFLRVVKWDGTKEHIPGPAFLIFDPMEHKEVLVVESMRINAHEAIVTYRENEQKSVTRFIVKGPKAYIPHHNEWIHQFVWHGADPANSDRKIPNALTFIKLRLIADQMYISVPQVRTRDDATLSIQLMVFYNLDDIHKMLDSSHDPIGDFLNAVSSDVIDFVGALTFEEFKQKLDKLNEIKTFPTLLNRAKKIGYTMEKVVFRGYRSSPQLEQMHNSAIETRTQLTLEQESMHQNQSLLDYQLQKEASRASAQQSLERQKEVHITKMQAIRHEEELRKKAAEAEAELEFTRRKNQEHLEQEERKSKLRIQYLQDLAGLGVKSSELAQLLVAEAHKPDKLVKVDSTNSPRLHIHE